MKTKYIIPAILMFITISSYAQQDAQYNHYMFNKLLNNPAYAGTKELLNVVGVYSSQWTGLNGAPVTQSLSIEGAATEKVGLGLHIMNDKIGAQSQQSFFGSYSYKVQLSNTFKLSMGIAVGATNNSINGNELSVENIDDPAIPRNRENALRFDSKAGLFMYSERFYAGFSSTGLLADVFKSEDLMVAAQSRHFYLTSGYVFDLNENFKMKPSFLIKEDFKAPSNIDISNFLLYKDKIWLGATARFGAVAFKKESLDQTLKLRNALVFMTEWNITDNFRIGYANTVSLSALSKYSGHEFIAGYYFAPKVTSKMKTPRYF